jgi:hypothetical protein
LNFGGASKIQCILIEETVFELNCIGLDPWLYNPPFLLSVELEVPLPLKIDGVIYDE